MSYLSLLVLLSPPRSRLILASSSSSPLQVSHPNLNSAQNVPSQALLLLPQSFFPPGGTHPRVKGQIDPA
eukprot:6145836-Pyramimonas_sp.AAC.1